jgi:transcription initiation factor TFIIIB Brf1 subunit/transcription initiation factor TFIIB
MIDKLSSSRIHTTHKTYKNKLYNNTNITGLWEKISESFHIENDRYNSGQDDAELSDKSRQDIEKIDKNKEKYSHTSGNEGQGHAMLPKKSEKNIECIYRSCGQRENCDTCNSAVALSDEGFLVCMNPKCSIIYKDIVDQSAEWRYYGVDDNQNIDPTRCGLPVNPLLVESSFGCKILCDGISSYEMRKIRRYTEWQSSPHKEKTQYNEFQHITIIANNAGIPKIIIDEALRCHKKISEHQTFRGSNRDGIIAASVYVAFRIHDCPRTAKEIATIFNLDNTSATKGCKNAVCILNEIENDMHNSEKTSFCKTRPEAFIERYCTRLQINGELTKLCQFIALRIEKNNLIPENTPHSIAAGIIYFVSQVCGLTISKKDVNKISETSEVTINKCYKKLEGIKELLIPKVILDKYSPKK